MTKITLPKSPYFDLPVSVWNHSLNAREPWNESLGDFLSGNVFTKRNIRIKIKDLIWFFKPNPKYNNKSIINQSLIPVVSKIVDGKSIPDIVESLRAYIKINGKDEVVDAVKKMIPGATVSASFDRIRGKKQPKQLNNMIALDIDNVDTTSTINKLKSLNICFWISKSITGTGVYALVPLATSDLIGHFEAINLIMQEHGIILDPLKDETRLRYWSPPNDAVIDVNVKPFTEIYKIPEEVKLNRGSKEHPIQKLKSTTEYDLDDYARACHKKGLKNAANNLGLVDGEIGAHLHLFIKYYHWAFNHYGISLAYAAKWSWENFFSTHKYIIGKGHRIGKILSDFSGFYKTYSNQHHLFDFNLIKQKSLSTVSYDIEFTIPKGKKLNTIHLPILFTKNELKQIHDKDDIGEWNKFLLDSPTNSGKTSTFSRYFLTEKVKGLIVVPTQGALEQIQADHQKATLFYEKSKDVKKEDLLICTTYASFVKLTKMFDVTDRVLVVDEFHNTILSSAKEFRNYELNSIIDKLEKFSRVVLMTGTNLKSHHPALSNFKNIKVKYEHDTRKDLQIVYYSSKNKWSSVLEKLSKYKSLQVIYMDDKQETGGLGKLIQSLRNKGYNESEIQLANSDQKNNEQYKNLIISGKVEQGIKIIIATKIFVEALNLYNNVDAFHILTPIHGAYMQQLVTRPRNNQRCDVYLYWHENNLKDQDTTFWFDQESYYQSQLSLAKNFIRAFENTEWDDIHRKNFNGNDVVRKRKVDVINTTQLLDDPHATTSTMMLDYDYLNCEFLTQDVQKKYYPKNPEQLYEYLKQYNWHSKPAQLSNVKKDTIDQTQINAIRKSRKDEVSNFIWELIQTGTRDNEERINNKDYETKGWQIEIRKWYLYLGKVLREEDANVLMLKLQDNKREHQQMRKKIQIRQALIHSVKGRADSSEFATKIFDEFPLSSSWDSREILQKMNTIIKDSYDSLGKIAEQKTQTAATQLLSQYIELKRVKKINPSGQPAKGRKTAYINAYQIVSHHPIRCFKDEPIEPIIGSDEIEYRTPEFVTWSPLPKDYWDELSQITGLPLANQQDDN